MNQNKTDNDQRNLFFDTKREIAVRFGPQKEIETIYSAARYRFQNHHGASIERSVFCVRAGGFLRLAILQFFSYTK